MWTYSIWETEADLEAFLNDIPHIDAVISTDQAINKMRSKRFRIRASKLPHNWDEIENILKQESFKSYKPI